MQTSIPLLVVQLVLLTSPFPLASAQSNSYNPNPQTPACGDVFVTLTRDDLVDFLTDSLGNNDPTTAVALALLEPRIQYGVQVLKVCGACEEFESLPGCTRDADNNDENNNDSPPYGHEQTHSGLLVLPIVDDEDDASINDDNNVTLVEGTHLMYITCHGTQGSTEGFTSQPRATQALGLEVIASMLMTSIGGHVGIIPDYMGYGESRRRQNSDGTTTGLFRGYLIRPAYRTATFPLIYRAQEMVRTMSDCRTAISNTVVPLGYSEGGYAAIALADHLFQTGTFAVANVRAGGAPTKLSSAQLSSSFRQFDQGIFDATTRFYIALLGSAFSDTYPGLPNFGQNQSALHPDFRDTIVDLVHSDTASTQDINESIDPNDPWTILSPVVREMYASDNVDACTTQAVDGVSNLLCASVQQQDLDQILREASYPVTLCHSPDDEAVSFDNVPDFLVDDDANANDANPNLSFVPATGSHTAAALLCYFNTVNYFANLNMASLGIADVTTASCASTEPRPSTSTDADATTSDAPTAAPEAAATGGTLSSDALSITPMGKAATIITSVWLFVGIFR